MIKTPTPFVLDYIDRHYTYDAETGIIFKDKKRAGGKRYGHMIVTIVLDSTYEGCALYYITYAHQLVWYLHHKVWPDRFIDHIDGDGLNNRIANLRLANPGQNSYNKRKKNANGTTSQYKGVNRRGNKYRAKISCNGTVYGLGTFSTEKEAALAYNAKALELFGEYAYLNSVS